MDSMVLCQTPQSQLTLSAELRKVIHERNILTTRTRMKVLSELDGITRHSNEESQMSRRDKTIQEILTSEVSYLHQLELLTQYFMEPLKAMPCISSVEYMTLFGHLDTIYKVNGELLNEMKKTPNNIGEVFIKLAPFFKLYSVYAYDYKNVLKLLQDMQSNNPQLKEFIHQQETLPEVGTSLPALLITPIQRVPRYRLLLQEVLSLTPSTHPDYSVLQRSLLEVERTASHINNLVQEQESMQQMVELQRSLQNGRPSIVVPGRRLLKEGLLMKVSPHGKRAHCRYFVLFNDLLMYCKVVRPAAHRPRLLRCCCVLPLKKCRVDDVIGKGMFKVACQGETLLLYSASLEDTQGWVTALTAAVKQYHESRQTLRRDSSNRKPMRQGDFTLDLPTPILHVKCRKRRRSAVEDTGGASSSTSQENIFKKFIWRKSLQANPEKIAKFEDGDNSGKTENQLI
ncbi:GD13075 [Gryllus bimaculatus]|nr:GD13075 [Gryllus bimaculatus]